MLPYDFVSSHNDNSDDSDHGIGDTDVSDVNESGS